MADAAITVEWATPGDISGGDLVIFVDDALTVPSILAERFAALPSLVTRAAAIERFKGKAKKTMAVTAPADLDGAERLVAIGIGASAERDKLDWVELGGTLAGRVAGRAATIALDGLAPEGDLPGIAASLALGARLRAYTFDSYKTKKDEEPRPTRLVFALAEADKARDADRNSIALAEGVNLARDLVNEPPNILFPLEFARRAEELSAFGVEVEVLGKARLDEIGMRALLAVGQGSAHDSCVAVMRWKGGRDGDAPLAVIGKGVCFDSGGISIKPSGGMEDMKGDMAGAACVVGLMHALAKRGAKANVVGVIGLTENMPDGAAQRPGDIIRTLSGQTVEMVNSDAEGRLVLGDVLWWIQDEAKPAAMIDLATLTGAILVALGAEHAGLFSNNDDLAARLTQAGLRTGEKVWRMPLGKAYDKLIDSKFADMKNTGGRHGGSITAAQFLQRFVRDDLPWAHLDIAGTGMNAPQTETNKSWTSGWGVRLLDQLIRNHYETGDLQS